MTAAADGRSRHGDSKRDLGLVPQPTTLRRALTRSRASCRAWSRTARPRRARVPRAFLKRERTRHLRKTEPCGLRMRSLRGELRATRTSLEGMRAWSCRFTFAGAPTRRRFLGHRRVNLTRTVGAEGLLPNGAAAGAKAECCLGIGAPQTTAARSPGPGRGSVLGSDTLGRAKRACRVHSRNMNALAPIQR